MVERIDRLLQDTGRAMSGSSASKRRTEDSTLRLNNEICPHCGRDLEARWIEFPPGLQKKYGKSGVWDHLPCTSECERKNERHEWELMRRDARVEALLEKSGLSKRLRRCTLSTFKPYVSPSSTRALEKIEEYLNSWEECRDEGRGLFFCGDVGTGKTHLAVAVMRELIDKKRVPALFVTVPELLENLRGAYNEPDRNIDEWMSAVNGADLLVLDDLGSERVTEWVQERIYIIINHRYQAALPTIFTSNVGPKDIAAHLGARISSRVIAMCDWISLEGQDYREVAAKERG